MFVSLAWHRGFQEGVRSMRILWIKLNIYNAEAIEILRYFFFP